MSRNSYNSIKLNRSRAHSPPGPWKNVRLLILEDPRVSTPESAKPRGRFPHYTLTVHVERDETRSIRPVVETESNVYTTT